MAIATGMVIVMAMVMLICRMRALMPTMMLMLIMIALSLTLMSVRMMMMWRIWFLCMARLLMMRVGMLTRSARRCRRAVQSKLMVVVRQLSRQVKLRTTTGVTSYWFFALGFTE